ncbi:MAG: hypothetical protein R3E61_06505 [Pseudomonadales bacterium]
MSGITKSVVCNFTWQEGTSLYYYYAEDSKVWDGVQRRIILEHAQPLPFYELSLLLTAARVDLETNVGRIPSTVWA